MKVELGSKYFLYPLPSTLVGATADGKPNYITIAYLGIMDLESVSLERSKAHFTNAA